MKTLFIVFIVGLSGCASTPEYQAPMSPEEAQYRRAMAMQMFQNMNQSNQQTQQNNNAIMQNYQQQLQNSYRRPARTNCTTNMIGGTAYTNCAGN